MVIVKYAGILLLIITSSIIGNLYAKKYSYRVKDLEEIRNALNMFKSKIRFTYEPIPEVFMQISNEVKPNIGKIFLIASENMHDDIASKAWENSLEKQKLHTSFYEDDITILKDLSKMLGNTDLAGQVSAIELTCDFLDHQIKEAQEEKNKNEKLYQTLSTGLGLTIAIILI